MKRPGSVKIFSFRGVDLFIHVSLILLLAYVVLIAAFQFPLILQQSGIDPDLLSGGPWSWGFAFAIGLFVSVALHEFGHALTAQAMGVKVKGITLMMLGGVSEMERIPEKHFHEFWLAIVGPIVSLALALGLAWVSPRVASANLALFCFWLGSVNLMLAIFNLVPAFPLDGGRALRSLLAVRMGFVRATRVSVRTSQFLAWTLGLLGLLGFNFFLVMIAFFVYVSAQSELAMVMARGALKGMKVSEVAVRVPTVGREATLRDAVTKMMSSRVSLLPLQRIDGDMRIITLRHLASVPKRQWEETRVSEIAERPGLVVDGDQAVNSVIRELSVSPDKSIPVSENGEITGVIRYADLAELLQIQSLDGAEEDQEKAA